jgi:hypothetical protein
MKHFPLVVKTALSVSLLLLFVTACNNDTAQHKNNNTSTGLSLDTSDNAELAFNDLRLYPITAEAVMLANNALPALSGLSKAMEMPGFRITERKNFGDGSEAWYHALTIQNKTQDTIYMMSGDVVTGGNQDRVIAYDGILPPRSLKNIEVFCVERGRSHYYNSNADQAEKDIAAFKGYYNVASPSVRKAVHSGNQQGVWDAVSKVTLANDATSTTDTYAALDKETDKKAERDAYLRYFSDKMQSKSNVTGMVAVFKGKVIAVDIFGSTDLFQQQYNALLHGYVAEAMMFDKAENSSTNSDESPAAAFNRVARMTDSAANATEKTGKFILDKQHWVHLYSK